MITSKGKKYFPYCEVVYPLPIQHAFTYEIPEHLQSILAPGSRILAPFGERRLTGFVVALTAHRMGYKDKVRFVKSFVPNFLTQ